MPLVTIAIPCFNAERWIGRTVQSALDQSWPDKEVIVVDDGSTDGSRERLASFGTAIRLIPSAHAGGNAARNIALESANGEWVQFLDADDYLETEKLRRQLTETSEGCDADVLYSPTWTEDTRSGERTLNKIDTSLDLHAQWFAWQIPQTGGAVWRRSSLQSIGGWKAGQPCCQEHELYMRALEAGLRFRFAPSAHAVYCIWSEETVCRRNPRLLVQVRTALIDRHREWMENQKLWTESHRRVAGQACFEMARTLAKYDLKEAAAYYEEREQKEMLHIDGPAAPLPYRAVRAVFGFTVAERVAAKRRT